MAGFAAILNMKKLILSEENIRRLTEWFGPNRDNWTGKKVKLFREKVRDADGKVIGETIGVELQPTERKTKMQMLTRADEVGATPYDSVKWAIEVHLKETDTGEFSHAVLYGNEDCPDRIDFYADEPTIKTPPRRIWERKSE